MQSGPGAEVKLFTSSTAETKEQWERQSERSGGTYYQPRGLGSEIARRALVVVVGSGLYMQLDMQIRRDMSKKNK